MHLIHRTFGAAILRAPDDAAASGPLNVASATAAILALASPPEVTPEPAPEPVTPEPAESADPGEPATEPPESEPEAQPAETPDAAETPSAEEPAEPPEPEAPAIEPPHFWAAEDKAEFKALPRQLQEKVLAYERNRDTAASKAIQQAREAETQAQAAKEAADREASAVAEIKAKVDKLAPDAEAQHRERWGDNPDWVALQNACLQQYPDNLQQGLAHFQALQAQYSVETQNLQGLRAAKQQLDAKAEQAKADAAKREQDAYVAFVQAESERLKTVEPDLADPKHGPERRQKVAQFLIERGVPAEQIRHAGAVEISLAYDAMRWRQAQAAAKAAGTQPKPPAPAAPARPTVRPTSAPAVVPQAQRTAQESKNRFAQKPTVDNAVAAILARSAGQKG